MNHCKEVNGQNSLKQRIAELDAEIERYRQLILDYEGALDSAEKDMNDLLAELTQSECSPPDET